MYVMLTNKGAFKYYVSALGGVGGLGSLADAADALKGGGGSRTRMLM